MILYTSGTTGKPKGAMLAHCNLIHSAMIYEACLELTPADRSIAAVPLAHVTGIAANIMAMAAARVRLSSSRNSKRRNTSRSQRASASRRP